MEGENGETLEVVADVIRALISLAEPEVEYYFVKFYHFWYESTDKADIILFENHLSRVFFFFFFLSKQSIIVIIFSRFFYGKGILQKKIFFSLSNFPYAV